MYGLAHVWDRPVLPKRAAEMQPAHRTDRPNVCSLACLGTGQEDAMEAGLPAADGGRDGVGDAVAEQGRVLQQHAHPRAAATCKNRREFGGSEIRNRTAIAWE